MTKKRRRLKQVEAWLVANFPTHKPVRVRVEQFGGDDRGHCWDRADGYLIRVRSRMTLTEQIDTLLHEWGHAARGCMDHGERWGARFQKIYQQFFDEGGAEESRGL